MTSAPLASLRTLWRVAALAVTASACASLPAPTPYRAPERFPAVGARVVVLGDTQRTSALEFWRESNTDEQRRLLAAVAEARPDLVLLTGDLVFDGASESDWAVFDALMAPIRATPAAVVAARGNHEYWGSDEAGWVHWRARFPTLTSRWFALDVGALRVVVLDSNPDSMPPDDWSAQLDWYRSQLSAADADPKMRGVVVAFHHPPYTNSTVTGDEPHVQRDLVPPFAAAKKTCAMLNGHVHNYERYQRDGKTYVVSGGGGGPRAALAEGSARRHTDDTFDGGPLRDFHFTVYTVAEAGLEAEVWGLAKGAERVARMSTFTLPWPAPAP